MHKILFPEFINATIIALPSDLSKKTKIKKYRQPYILTVFSKVLIPLNILKHFPILWIKIIIYTSFNMQRGGILNAKL